MHFSSIVLCPCILQQGSSFIGNLSTYNLLVINFYGKFQGKHPQLL